MNVEHSPKKRTFIAENLAKIGEYVLAIVVLGNLISDKVNAWALAGGIVVFLVAMIFAVVLYPNNFEQEGN